MRVNLGRDPPKLICLFGSIVHEGCRGLKSVSSVAATSLSDIVCGFHVAGCCTETTSDPTKRLTLAQPRNWSGAARLALRQTAVAIVCRGIRRVAQDHLNKCSRPDLTASKTPYAAGFIEQLSSSPMGSRAV